MRDNPQEGRERKKEMVVCERERGREREREREKGGSGWPVIGVQDATILQPDYGRCTMSRSMMCIILLTVNSSQRLASPQRRARANCPAVSLHGRLSRRLVLF